MAFRIFLFIPHLLFCLSRSSSRNILGIMLGLTLEYRKERTNTRASCHMCSIFFIVLSLADFSRSPERGLFKPRNRDETPPGPAKWQSERTAPEGAQNSAVKQQGTDPYLTLACSQGQGMWGGLGWNRAQEAGMNLSLWAFNEVTQNQKYISQKSSVRITSTDSLLLNGACTALEPILHLPNCSPSMSSWGESGHWREKPWVGQLFCMDQKDMQAPCRSHPAGSLTGSESAAFLPLKCSALSPRWPEGERKREEDRGGNKEVREGERWGERTDEEDSGGKKMGGGRWRSDKGTRERPYEESCLQVPCCQERFLACFLGCWRKSLLGKASLSSSLLPASLKHFLRFSAESQSVNSHTEMEDPQFIHLQKESCVQGENEKIKSFTDDKI